LSGTNRLSPTTQRGQHRFLQRIVLFQQAYFPFQVAARGVQIAVMSIMNKKQVIDAVVFDWVVLGRNDI
jgi:hypothetical protein